VAGSKPLALHTEFAYETADQDRPYGGGQDIVFYLQRADQGGEGGGDLPVSEDGMFKSMAGGGTDYYQLTDDDMLLLKESGGFITDSAGETLDLDYSSLNEVDLPSSDDGSFNFEIV
jgi:hypothetical protein